MTEVVIRFVEGAEREVALKLEERIFREENYPYDYRRFDEQSRVFAAFIDGACVGVLRVIAQSPLLPPVLEDCDVWDIGEWQAMGEKFAELGTQAVLEEYRHSGVGLSLIRAAYVDARLRGLVALAVITEPENVDFLNNTANFACRQIGGVGFKGWECAPYIHVFSEVEVKLAAADPGSYAWFTEGIPDDLLAVPRS